MLEPDGEPGRSEGDDSAAAMRRSSSLAPPFDLLVIAGAVLLCIAFAPVFVSAPYSPRFALLLGFLPVGLVLLVALGLRRDRAAIAGIAFLVVAMVSSLLSEHIRVSLIGQMGKEASALLLTAFLGWWAIGRQMSERGKTLLPYGLLIGLGFNAMVAILQATFPTSNSEFGVPDGERARGLTANPVQLGALMAAGVVISSCLAVDSTHKRFAGWCGAVVLFGIATNLSGTRVAMLAVVVVLAGLFVVRRTVRVPILLAAFAAGVGLSTLIDNGDASSTLSRVASSGYGRTDAWRFGLDAFLDRPILGFGPGGFRPATQGRFTSSFVRTAAYDDQTSAWFDAHNLFVEVLVATGIIGLVLLIAFGWFALRQARGPLLAAFVAIAITWAMQPMSVSTAPLALLCLGAAAPLVPNGEATRRRSVRRPVLAVAAAFGMLVGVGYAFIDARLDAAIADGNGDGAEIEDAARPFGNDAIVADLVAQGWANAYLYDGADRSHLVKWAAEPALREPDRPFWWSKKAGTQMAFKDLDGARESLDRAIALQPWSPSAWPLMMELAKQTDDPELEALATEKVCELQLDSCPNENG